MRSNLLEPGKAGSPDTDDLISNSRGIKVSPTRRSFNHGVANASKFQKRASKLRMAEIDTTIAPLTLDKQQAAAALNVPVDTLLNLTRTVQLRCVQIGKHKRWLLDDLREYVENQRDEGACTRTAG